MTIDELKKLPKIELHCHLDGSLSREFIGTRLGRAVSVRELSVEEDCRSLAEYLEKFDLPCSCLKDEDGLEGAGYDVLRTMSRENVCYAEIRFAPLLSVTEEMGTGQVISALLKGLEKGKKDFGVEYNVITCAMRHHSEEENYQMIRTAREFLGKGVCAADLAGAEAVYPMSDFMSLFKRVKELGMPLEKTLPYMTSQVAEALDLLPKKGVIKEGSDADLLLFEKDMTLSTYIAKGKVFMKEKNLMRKGTYE